MAKGQSEAVRKIAKAAAATAAVQALVGKALESLVEMNPAILNGSGVYLDAEIQRARLHAARLQLDAALKLMDETAWPTDQDYAAAQAEE